MAAIDDLVVSVNGFLGRFVKLMEVIVSGWKSFFLPAEPLINVFGFNLAANQVLNNQAIDLRLPYDYYVYGIARQSTGVFSFSIKASGGGVLFSNANVRSDVLWSLNEPVLWLRRPFKILAGASLSIDLTDLSAAPNAGQIVFVGWKASSQFTPGQQQQLSPAQ